MSGQATGWVLKHGPHPDHIDRHGKRYGGRARGLRMVLLAVADAANRDGKHAHPGIENVADAALYSRGHAIEILKELCAEGWLIVREAGGGRGTATVYDFPGSVISQNIGLFPNTRCHASDHAKQSDLSEETVRFSEETVRSGPDPNGITTEKNNGVALAEANAAADPSLAANNPQLFKAEPDGSARAVAGPRGAADAKVSSLTHFDRARRICMRVWEQRDPRPASSFMGAARVCERLLKAGHTEEAVERAAMTVPTLTIAAMEVELAKGAPRRPARHKPELKPDDDDDGGSGEVVLGEDGSWRYVG